MSNARSIADLLGKAGEFSDTEVVLGDSSDTRLFIPGVGLDTNLATDNSSPVWNASTGKFTFSPVGTGTNVYDSASSLPITGVSTGQQAFAKDTNRLYLYNGSGWYSVALINRNPSITSTLQSSYTLDSNAGDATVITILAQDSDGIPLTYTATTTDSGNDLATITQGTGDSSNVFTIQAKTLADILSAGYDSNGGTFDITFRASDGINLAAVISEFTISFSVDPIENSKYTTLLLKSVGANNGTNSDLSDTSTNNHTITENGDPYAGTFSPHSAKGVSYYFNGSNSFIELNSNNIGTGSGFIIEAWIRPTVKTSSYGIIASQDDGGSNNQIFQFRYDYSTNKVEFVYWNTSTRSSAQTMSSTNTFALDEWHHVAIVREGSNNPTTMKLYVNGSVEDTATDAMYLAQSQPLQIGNFVGNNYSFYFQGWIKDFRIVRDSSTYEPVVVPTQPLTIDTPAPALLICNSYAVDNAHPFVSWNTISYSNSIVISPVPTPYDNLEYNDTVNGGSIYFDGTGDYLTVTGDSSLSFGTGDFTIEFWCFASAYSSYQIAYDNRVGSATGIGIYLGNGGQLQLANNSAIVVSNAGSLIANRWHHIAVVRDSGTIYFYIDGQKSGTNYSDTRNYNGTDAAIGGNSGGQNFTGYLSDIRVVKGTALYTTDFYPPTEPLTAIANTSLLINGTDGSIIDYSGVENAKLVGDTKSSTTQTKYGTSSVYFDGTGDYIDISTGAPQFGFGTEDFTIEAWIYPIDLSTVRTISSQRQNSSGNNNFAIVGSKVSWSNGANWLSGSTDVSTNQWSHVAVTRQSGTVRVFLNGTLDGSGTRTDDLGASRPARIGALLNDAAGPFYGYMEDVRLTKGLARYTANFTPPTAGLKG